MNWNEYFFEMCKIVSLKSKDINTKVGCVIVGPDNEIRSTGFNGLPRNVVDSIDDVPNRYERPEKYIWTEHSERNAIYSAARIGIPLKDCKIYLTWMPCADCARAIIQSGIKQVYVMKWDYEDITKFPQFRFDVTIQMFKEAEIQLYI